MTVQKKINFQFFRISEARSAELEQTTTVKRPSKRSVLVIVQIEMYLIQLSECNLKV